MTHIANWIALLGVLLSFLPPVLHGAWIEEHYAAATNCWVAGLTLMVFGVLGLVF